MARYIGSNRSEVIYGSNFRDIIYGNGGADDIYGKGGADDLYGDSGNDYIYGGDGADYLWGGTGTNDLWGGWGYDRFITSNRNSGYSDDLIHDFHSGSDQIDLRSWGVSSMDQLRDILLTDHDNNVVFHATYNGYGHSLIIDGYHPNELSARDFVFDKGGSRDETGTRYGDVMFGSQSSDTLDGAGGADKILGGNSSDKLFGGEGADRLYGGTGNDKLAGDAGRDQLVGGGGVDTFIFNEVTDSRGSQRDTIVDFKRAYDHIDVSGIDADKSTAGDDAFTFVGDSVFTGVGQINFTRSGSDIIVAGNTDTDTDAEFQFIIHDIRSINVGDFIL